MPGEALTERREHLADRARDLIGQIGDHGRDASSTHGNAHAVEATRAIRTNLLGMLLISGTVEAVIRNLPAALVCLGLAGGVTTACGDTGSGAKDGKLTVAVAFSPLADIVHHIGGDHVHVVTIVPPGQEAHEYEPTAQQIAKLEDADIVFYLGRGFQPGVEQALKVLPGSVQRIDLLDTVTLLPVTDQLPGTDGEVDGESLDGGVDPHVWLDPMNMATMSRAVVAELDRLDEADAATFDAGALRYSDSLSALDADFTAGLAHCESDVIITSHRAFEYLAQRYHLRQIPIGGITPEVEPSAKTLESVAAAAEANGVTTIYFEENLPEDLARTVAAEIGATTATLDPIESMSNDQIDAGATYVSVMRQNLAALQLGLRCS